MITNEQLAQWIEQGMAYPGVTEFNWNTIGRDIPTAYNCEVLRLAMIGKLGTPELAEDTYESYRVRLKSKDSVPVKARILDISDALAKFLFLCNCEDNMMGKEIIALLRAGRIPEQIPQIR